MALAKTNKSVTKELLKLRFCSSCKDTIQAGRWYDGFTKVKTFAASKKIPFIAVWTNGDKCGYCVKLEKCFLDADFINWMKTSGCIFWLGTGTDTNKEDGYNGSGFKWIYQNGKISTYPFVRVYWPDGKVDETMTGNALDGRMDPPKGTKEVLEHLKKLLKNWKPKEEPSDLALKQGVPPPPPPQDAPEKKEPEVPAPAPAPAPKNKLKVRTNPEWTAEKIAEFKQTIKDNGGFCPCQPQSPDSKCMCKLFREMKPEDVPAEGKLCVCGLYQKYWA